MPNTSISQRARFLKYFGFSVMSYFVQNKIRFFSGVDSLPNKKKNIFYIRKTRLWTNGCQTLQYLKGTDF